MFLDELDKKIRKISLKERFEFTELFGFKSTNIHGTNLTTLGNNSKEVYGHEIALIAIRSLLCGTGHITETGKNTFRNIVNLVRNQGFFSEFAEKYDSLYGFLVLLYMQLPHQKKYDLIVKRYKYIFNFENDVLNMRDEVVSKLKINTEEITDVLLLFISSFAVVDSNLRKDYLRRISEIYPDVFNLISITMDGFKTEHKRVEFNDKLFKVIEFNTLKKYPIIKYNKDFFIPYAPFLVDALTETILYRLTDIGHKKERDKLREKIGKNVFEGYFNYIYRESRFCNEYSLIEEFTYEIDGNKKSHDFYLVDELGSIFAFELKLMGQPVNLRLFDEKIMGNFTTRVAKHFAQCYTKIQLIKSKKIRHDLFNDKSIESVFGICVVFDDVLLFREKIYEKTIDILNQSEYDATIDQLKKTIMLLALSNLEEISFYGDYSFDRIKENFISNRESNDFGFMSGSEDNIIGGMGSIKELNGLIEDVMEKNKEYLNK